eukprot:g1251.t1
MNRSSYRRNSIKRLYQLHGSYSSVENFKKLDTNKLGKVSYDDFLANADDAFSRQHHGGDLYPPSKGSMYEFVVVKPVQPIPSPPPMTRELMYRAVFNQIDRERRGYITALNLQAAMKSAALAVKESYIHGCTHGDRSQLCTNQNSRSLRSRRKSLKGIRPKFSIRGTRFHCQKHINLLNLLFGVTSDMQTMAVFQALDTEGNGRVKFEDFFFNCSKAFDPSITASHLSDAKKPFHENTTENDVPLHESIDKLKDRMKLLHGQNGDASSLPLLKRDLDVNDSEHVSPDGIVVLPVASCANVEPPLEAPNMPPDMLHSFIFSTIERKHVGWFSLYDFLRSTGRGSAVRTFFGTFDTIEALEIFQMLDVEGTGKILKEHFMKMAEEIFSKKLDTLRRRRKREKSGKSKSIMEVCKTKGNIPKPPPLPGFPLTARAKRKNT